MTETLNAHETVTETLDDGESLSVTLPTRNASDITTFVDDGAGGAPATYDLLLDYRPTGDAAWMPYDEITGTTARSWLDPATAGEWRATVTNTSGGQVTLRTRLVAHGGGE